MAESSSSAAPASSKTKKPSGGLKPSTIRIGRRYRANRLDGPYDAIVIGSGIGGLTTASLMAHLGKKVVVLEQHYTAGGFTHSYARNGYEWDVGVHYIGDMGHPTMGRRLFDFVTDQNLEWAAMDDHYDRIFLGDEHFDLVAGKQAFKDELKRHFPQESNAIDRYVAMLDKASASMKFVTLAKLFKPWQAGLLKKALSPMMPDYLNRPTYEVLKEITDNEKLISVLTGQWGDCGMTPKTSSFMIHALIARHYMHGGFYPVGGASKMAETIIPGIQAAGGEVFTYASVDQILVEKGKAVGVRMADGAEVRAPLVISNAGVFNTFNRLLPEPVVKKAGYRKKLKKIRPSMANLGMFIGLKGDAESLQLPKTNFWIYPDEDHDGNMDRFLKNHEEPFPVVYVSFPSAKDPSFSKRYPDRATIEIVAPANFDLFEKWKDKTWGKRGDDYDSFKGYFAERMLEVMYQKLPHLRGKIDYYETSTPLSTDYFCYYPHGEIYGLDHDPQRFEQDWLQPRTKIPGLYMTGQDVLSCGVVGAMMGGLLTTVNVMGWDGVKLAKQIMTDKPDHNGPWVVEASA